MKQKSTARMQVEWVLARVTSFAAGFAVFALLARIVRTRSSGSGTGLSVRTVKAGRPVPVKTADEFLDNMKRFGLWVEQVYASDLS